MPCALFILGCGGADVRSWSLVDHFAFATIGANPTVIDLGTPEARLSLLSGWSHDEGGGDVSFAWGIGGQSVLGFLLDGPRDLTVTFRCSPFDFAGAPPQVVTFDLNGAPGPQVTLRSGMGEYDVALPAAASRSGWNRLAIRYVRAHAPSEVHGSPDARRLAVAWDVIRIGRADAKAGVPPSVERGSDVLVIPTGTSVGYHLRVPERARLRFADVAFDGDAAVTLAIRLEKDGAASEIVARLRPADATREIPIADRWSGVVRLSLAVEGVSGGVRLVRPRIESIDGGSHSSRPATPARRQPNVVLYLVDTLRADGLGCYGNAVPTSPHLDAFARDAIRFTDAIAEAPWTRASVASLFTGLPARSHGVNGRTDALPEEAVTMAELFAQAGYETAAFVTNGNVAPAYGFAQGFDAYDLLPGAEIPGPDGIVLQPLPISADVTARAVEWFERRTSSRPFLLYLHTADPHGPYDPAAEVRARLGVPTGANDLGSLATLRLLHAGKLPVDTEMVRSMRSLYDAEVAENDEQFGRVTAALRARGMYDDAVIIVLSDHGEEFYEHEGWEHGHTLYGELTHVPLLIKPPGSVARGARDDRTVQLGDVLPTLLAYVDVAAPNLPGTSLLATPGEGAARQAVSHLDLDGRAGDSVVEGRWHFIRTAERVALFDRVADPREQRDVAAEHPVIAGFMTAQLAERASGPRTLPRRQAVITEDVHRNLKALGYVQ